MNSLFSWGAIVEMPTTLGFRNSAGTGTLVATAAGFDFTGTVNIPALGITGSLDLALTTSATDQLLTAFLTETSATNLGIAVKAKATQTTNGRTTGALVVYEGTVTSLTGTTAGVPHVVYDAACVHGDADATHIVLRQGANFDTTIDSSLAATGEVGWIIPDAKASAFVMKDSGGNNFLLFDTAAVDGMAFGNAVTNPVYDFLGTGATTFGGSVTAVGLICNSTADINAIIDQDTSDTAGTGAAYDSLGTSTSATGSYAIIKGTFQQLTNAKTAGVGFGVQGTYVGLAGDTSGAIVGGLYAAAPTLNGGSATDCGLAIAAGYTNDIYFVDTTAVITVQDASGTALTIRDSAGQNFLVVDTAAVDGMTFGNATTNPAYNFLGTGAMGVAGALNVTGLLTASGGIAGTALATDESVVATVLCADAGGGGTTALMSVQLRERGNASVISSARQVMLFSDTTQYSGDHPTNASLSLGTVTAGSVIATVVAGSMWLVETDATGLFACTATNTDDETVYFSCESAPAGISDLAKRCLVLASTSDAATWSA